MVRVNGHGRRPLVMVGGPGRWSVVAGSGRWLLMHGGGWCGGRR